MGIGDRDLGLRIVIEDLDWYWGLGLGIRFGDGIKIGEWDRGLRLGIGN